MPTFLTAEQLAQSIRLVPPLTKLNILQPFGVNNVYPGFYKKIGIENDLHNGLDYEAPSGTPCFAVCDGRVLTGAGGTAGMVIELESNEYVVDNQRIKLKIRYLHLQKFAIANGDTVKKGQLLGECDNTGYSTGAHLHFDIVPLYFSNYEWVADLANGFKGRINPEPLISPVENIDVAFLKGKTNKVLIRTESAGHGAVYVVLADDKIKFLDSEKGSDRHIPLVDFVLEELKKQGRLIAISEEQFNKIRGAL